MEKVLIAYASQQGSTKEAAGTIAEGLREVGLTVEVQAARDVDSLDDYDFVVLGTAVKGEDVLPEAAEFMEKWRTELRGKPAAYFALSMLMADPTDENRKHVAAILNKLRFEQRPWDLGIFGGVRDPEKMSMVLRWSVKQSKVPVGDFRDPAAMKAWAMRLGERIKEGKPY